MIEVWVTTEDGSLLAAWPCDTKDEALVEAALYAWAASMVGRLETATAYWAGRGQAKFEALPARCQRETLLTADAQVIAAEHFIDYEDLT